MDARVITHIHLELAKAQHAHAQAEAAEAQLPNVAGNHVGRLRASKRTRAAWSLAESWAVVARLHLEDPGDES